MIDRARSYQGLYITPLCIVLALACRTAMPGLGESASLKPVEPGAIITGTVTADASAIRVGGRRVRAINLSTGDRVTAITAGSGSYTLVLTPGRYRLEIDHASTETVTRARSEVTVGMGDLQDGFDIRIRSAHLPQRIYQPPLPTGSPIV